MDLFAAIIIDILAGRSFTFVWLMDASYRHQCFNGKQVSCLLEKILNDVYLFFVVWVFFYSPCALRDEENRVRCWILFLTVGFVKTINIAVQRPVLAKPVS